MGNRFQWLIALAVLAALAIVGAYTYNLGVAQGLAEGARTAAPGAGVPVAVWWPRPWFGFGFFPFFPLLFILFWFVVLRGVFWRGGWYGRTCGHQGVPPAFDEWHRRAHAGEGPPTAGMKA
jgi:hypothetical protein